MVAQDGKDICLTLQDLTFRWAPDLSSDLRLRMFLTTLVDLAELGRNSQPILKSSVPLPGKIWKPTTSRVKQEPFTEIQKRAFPGNRGFERTNHTCGMLTDMKRNAPIFFSFSIAEPFWKKLFCSRDCDPFWVRGVLCVFPAARFLSWVSVMRC